MLAICSVEIYKLMKRRHFIVLSLLASWSLIYGVGIFLHWDFIQIGAKLDLVTFITTMWTFLLILTIPLLMILYTSACVLGGEIQGGQILLEVNRVLVKKSLIVSKYIAVVISVFFLYIVNFLTSFITYVLFVSKSEFGYPGLFNFHSTNTQSLTVSLVNLGFIILLASISFYLSLYFSSMVSSIAALGIYFLCQLLSYIKGVSQFIPGYFFTVSDYNFSYKLIAIHLLLYIFLCIMLVSLSVKKFDKKTL